MDMDPGPNEYVLSGPPLARKFIQKVDPNGALIWAYPIGNFSMEFTNRSMAIDGNGDVIIAGRYSYAMDVDPGADTWSLVPYSEGVRDIFILKLNNDGQLLWAGRIGGDGEDRFSGVFVDDFHHVIIAGHIAGAGDLDPSAGTWPYTSVGDDDAFITKLSPSGDLIWARAYSTEEQFFLHACAVDGLGNVITSGAFSGTVDMDPGPGTANHTSDTLAEFGSATRYLSKLDANGTLVWIRFIGGGWYGSNSRNILSANATGDIFWSHQLGHSTDIDPGPGVVMAPSVIQPLFVARYRSNGTLLSWIFLNGPGWIYQDMKGLPNGSLLVSGATQGSIYSTTDQTIIVPSIGPSSSWHGFMVKLDLGMNVLWGMSIGGAAQQHGKSIDYHEDGSIIFGGSHNAAFDADPSDDVCWIEHYTQRDIWLTKYLDLGISVSAASEVRPMAGAAFPNPFVDRLSIPITSPLATSSSLTVMDALGNTIEVHDLDTYLPDRNIVDLHLAHLSSGVYLIRLAQEGTITYYKIIKEL